MAKDEEGNIVSSREHLSGCCGAEIELYIEKVEDEMIFRCSRCGNERSTVAELSNYRPRNNSKRRRVAKIKEKYHPPDLLVLRLNSRRAATGGFGADKLKIHNPFVKSAETGEEIFIKKYTTAVKRKMAEIESHEYSYDNDSDEHALDYYVDNDDPF